MQNIIFICPKCGSHELMRVERTLQCHRERRIVRGLQGAYQSGDSELDDIVSRGLAGLQCANCLYPDTRRGSFSWKNWQAAEAAGCLAPAPDDGKDKVACTVCALDGRAYRVHVLLNPGEGLPDELRQQLLTRVLHGPPGVVATRWRTRPTWQGRRSSFLALIHRLALSRRWNF